MIVRDIEKIADVGPSTKLAVKSSWRTPVQQPHKYSAFGASWSNETIFRVLTGNFVRAPLPNGACKEPVTDFWRVSKIGDTVVVCMR